MNEVGVGVSRNLIPFLKTYMSEEQAIEVAKKLTIRGYEIRQSLKNNIIAELKAVCKPDFSVPGHEILPANTIEIINEKYDYSHILNIPIEKIDFKTEEGII